MGNRLPHLPNWIDGEQTWMELWLRAGTWEGRRAGGFQWLPRKQQPEYLCFLDLSLWWLFLDQWRALYESSIVVRHCGRERTFLIREFYSPFAWIADLPAISQSSLDGQYWNQIDYILCSQRWRSSIQSAKTRPGADSGSDYELHIA